MKTTKIIITLLLTNLCFGQKTILLDSMSLEPIPYANIKFNSNQGVYSNEDGTFHFKEKTDSLVISSLGYNSKTILFTKMSDTIFLTPKIENLSEVVLDNRKFNTYDIGLLNKKIDFGWQMLPKSEFISYIKPNVEFKNSLLSKIKIPIKKSLVKKSYNILKKNNEGLNGICKINIYKVKNNLPNEIIFSSGGIVFNMNKKQEIEVDVSNKFIEFNDEGLCIGLEMIGRLNSKNEIEYDNHAQLMIAFTSKLTPDFKSITYHKSIFSDTDEFSDINKIYPSNKNYNLAIGMEVEIYE